jgi:hypothetical protein
MHHRRIFSLRREGTRLRSDGVIGSGQLTVQRVEASILATSRAMCSNKGPSEMWKIRQDQIDRMRQRRREQFESKIAEYIARELPDVRASLGKPGLLAGVTRAAAYLFETHRDVD